MDKNYRSLLHVYTMGGSVKIEKALSVISSLSVSHKKIMLKSLKTITTEIERQLMKEGN